MKNNDIINDLPGQSEFITAKQHKLAEQCLVKITSLQEQIDSEEKKLFDLLRRYGTDVINDSVLVCVAGN